MPPIHIYSHSPINAAKASGVTPQTDEPLHHGVSHSVSAAHPVTANATTPVSAAAAPVVGAVVGPSPQPGAVPRLPVPTGTAQPTDYTTQPAPSPSASRGPPPPQTAAPAFAYPPQMAIPPPPPASYPSRGTSTATTSVYPSIPQPSGLLFQTPVTMDHPPGYVQNTYATEITSAQRAAMRASSDIASEGSYDDDTDMWNTAKRFVKAAGGQLAAVETEIWRKVNKD